MKQKIKVAYLKKISTKKNGKSLIYSRTLYEVLKKQKAMEKPDENVLENEDAAKTYKATRPGIFPVVLPYDSIEYNDHIFRAGHVVFIDIDTTKLVDEVFDRSDELHARMPSLLAVWYSIRNKLHFAFLRPWHGHLEHAAFWKLISDELIKCVSEIFGKDVGDYWRRKNDRNLSTCKHLMSAGYTKDFKWFDDADLFEVDLELKKNTLKRYEYRNIKMVKPKPYSLFEDKEVKKKWKSCKYVKTFIEWCEKNRDYTYHTRDKDYEFKVENIDGESFDVWRNDGSLHVLTTYEDFKLSDTRKRHIAAAAVMAASFCGASFEESLYSASKFYLENCNEYKGRDNEKVIILPRVENAYANKKRNILMCESTGYLLEKRQVIIRECNPDDSDVTYTQSEITKIRAKVKSADRQHVFRTLYVEGDTTAIMTLKMRANGYPRISEQVVYKVARECGIELDKPENKYKGKYNQRDRNKGKYRNAYDRDGNRTMVLTKKIDNVNWFESKSVYEAYLAEEFAKKHEAMRKEVLNEDTFVIDF